jgi:hypothetical protein
MARTAGSWTLISLLLKQRDTAERGDLHGKYGAQRGSSTNAIHIPRPLFPLFHCHQPRTAGFQLSYRHPAPGPSPFSVDASKENGCLFCAPCHLGLLLTKNGCQLSYRHPAFRVLVRFSVDANKENGCLFPALHAIWVCCYQNGVPTIVAVISTVLVRFFWLTTRKRMPNSILNGFAATLREQVPDRTVIQLSGPSPFFC